MDTISGAETKDMEARRRMYEMAKRAVDGVSMLLSQGVPGEETLQSMVQEIDNEGVASLEEKVADLKRQMQKDSFRDSIAMELARDIGFIKLAEQGLGAEAITQVNSMIFREAVRWAQGEREYVIKQNSLPRVDPKPLGSTTGTNVVN